MENKFIEEFMSDYERDNPTLEQIIEQLDECYDHFSSRIPFWCYVQNNSNDKATDDWIFHVWKFQEASEKILQECASDSDMKKYSYRRWFTVWVSKACEKIFVKYGCKPNPIEKSKDFDFIFPIGYIYDLKTTTIPKDFKSLTIDIRNKNISNENLIKIGKWFYENQSQERRHGTQDRFFLIGAGDDKDFVIMKLLHNDLPIRQFIEERKIRTVEIDYSNNNKNEMCRNTASFLFITIDSENGNLTWYNPGNINRGTTVETRWKKYYNLPEIVEIRKKIVDSYSNKLKFIEETHQYFLDGEEYDCVSHVTHKYSPFDQEKVANETYLRAKDNPNNKYFGMTVKEIIKQWEDHSADACEKGTNVHAFAESLFYVLTGTGDPVPGTEDAFDGNMNPMPRNKKEEAVVKFWNDLPENFIPVLAETKVFNQRGEKYAGTFDVLFYYYDEKRPDRSGLVITDWKTNADLYKNFNQQTMLAPFDDYLDQPIGYYRLQFACYQIPIEYLGYKVIGRRLIWLKEDGEYDKIRIDDLSSRMKRELNIID